MFGDRPPGGTAPRRSLPGAPAGRRPEPVFQHGSLQVFQTPDGDPYHALIIKQKGHRDLPAVLSQIIAHNGGAERFGQALFRGMHQSPNVNVWQVIDELQAMGGPRAAAAKVAADLQAQWDREHHLSALGSSLLRGAYGAGDFLRDALVDNTKFLGDLVLGPGGTLLRRYIGPQPDWVPEFGRVADPAIEKGRAVVDYASQVAAGRRNPLEDAALQVGDAVSAARRGVAELAETYETGGAPAVAHRYSDFAGRVGAGVGVSYFGPSLLRTAGFTRPYSYDDEVAHWLGRGFNQKQAEHLAEPYDGVGHHSLPKRIGYGMLGLPKWIMESRFNVLKPPNISRGKFYVRHGKVDRFARGGPIVGKGKGSGWNRQSIGTELAGPLGRLYHGTTPELKTLVAMPFLGEEEAYPLYPTDAGPANEVDVMRAWRDEEDLPINP